MNARQTGRSNADLAPAGAWDYATTADLDRAPLHVSITPMPTMLTILRDALQGGRRHTPAEWREAVLSRLRARDAPILAPLADPIVTSYPSLLEDIDTRAVREPFGISLDRLSAVGGGTLVHALEHARDVQAGPAWEPVKHRPDRWLSGYVDALRRCWPAVEPLWRRSLALLEREEDRVHAAMQRGVAPSQVLAGLSPRAQMSHDALRIAPGDDASRRLLVDRRGATVIPMVVTSRAGTLSAPDVYLDWIGYPLPEAWRAFDNSAPPSGSLEALLGRQRAILLRGLDRERTAGQLARLLVCAPSVVTHHVRALEAAGLLDRRREGRHVVVRRSSRGTALLALYA
jgi:DNA-binding transcriptional ArsR family regulator